MNHELLTMNHAVCNEKKFVLLSGKKGWFMDEAPFEAAPTFSAPEKKKINKRFIYLVIVVILIVILFFWFRSLNANKEMVIENAASITPTQSEPTDTPASNAATATPSPTPVKSGPTSNPTNTPTPKPTINPVDKASGLDRSKLTVTVQNGSGEEGVGAKGSDYLKSLGYDVVTTGNADNFNYTSVTVEVKPTNQDFLDLLKKDLGFSYTVASSSSDLVDSFSSDALVIIGK
jgi:hypothetical protein